MERTATTSRLGFCLVASIACSVSAPHDSGFGEGGDTFDGHTGATSESQDDDPDEGSGDSTTSPPADDGSVHFDLGAQPDLGHGSDCEPGSPGGGETLEFSYLWAANSQQGTISKIDTQTVTEVGRYYVRPDGAGNPSRTSVSLSGNVAVASRSGGITKFWAAEKSCEEHNGMPGIQTSSGNTPLAWSVEECRAWHTPFDYDSQRPIAWAPGDWNPETCRWENERLWTAGRYGTTKDEVLLIDGDAGVVLDTVFVQGLSAGTLGLYGGAVDGEGNFWATTMGPSNHLVRVRMDDMSVTVWPGPSVEASPTVWYGMTVDVNGNIWNCSRRPARFDPTTELWTVGSDIGYSGGGCMADEDPDGLLWVARALSNGGVTGIDRETFEIVHQIPTPTSRGVSIDFHGYVWTVQDYGAHRIDPETGEVVSYEGLTGAYTYSDMTGYALSAVSGTPAG